MAKHNHHLPSFLLVLATTVYFLDGIANGTDMNGMPDDPVSGEMVMSKSYNLNLLNGQTLRFASQDTLDTFLQDPNMGLKEATSAPATQAHEDKEQSVLCPVCGMESSVTQGPKVVMLHGDQAVHTCSMTHAREVYKHILSFRALKESEFGEQEQDFCTGPGTTMLNGFSRRGTTTPCIVLWFPGWVLDSRWRYLFGSLFVALVAVCNEYLLQLRRVLRKESRVQQLMSSNALHATESARLLRATAQNMPLANSCAPAWFRTMSPEMQHGVHSVLHGVTLFVAYMLMLVSMTYDFTLLLWVVGGYVIGHFVFGERCEAPLSSNEMESAFP